MVTNDIFSKVYNEFQAIISNINRSNRDKCNSAVLELYKINGKNPPNIVWIDGVEEAKKLSKKHHPSDNFHNVFYNKAWEEAYGVRTVKTFNILPANAAQKIREIFKAPPKIGDASIGKFAIEEWVANVLILKSKNVEYPPMMKHFLTLLDCSGGFFLKRTAILIDNPSFIFSNSEDNYHNYMIEFPSEEKICSFRGKDCEYMQFEKLNTHRFKNGKCSTCGFEYDRIGSRDYDIYSCSEFTIKDILL